MGARCVLIPIQRQSLCPSQKVKILGKFQKSKRVLTRRKMDYYILNEKSFEQGYIFWPKNLI